MGALARNGLTVTNSLLHGQLFRSSHPEVFLGKDILKICRKFADKTHAEVRFKKKFQSNLITLRHEFSKFAAYFQNTFSYAHFWKADSDPLSLSYFVSYFDSQSILSAVFIVFKEVFNFYFSVKYFIQA